MSGESTERDGARARDRVDPFDPVGQHIWGGISSWRRCENALLVSFVLCACMLGCDKLQSIKEIQPCITGRLATDRCQVLASFWLVPKSSSCHPSLVRSCRREVAKLTFICPVVLGLGFLCLLTMTLLTLSLQWLPDSTFAHRDNPREPLQAAEKMNDAAGNASTKV